MLCRVFFEKQTLFCVTNHCLSKELIDKNAMYNKIVIEFGFCDIPTFVIYLD